MAVEKLGVPVAPIATEMIAKYILNQLKITFGMPLRFSFIKMPVMGASAATIAANVAGNDPITGKPFMQEVVDALTKPLTADEKLTGSTPQASAPPQYITDTEDNLQALFKQNDWTDYNTITLPTQERVNALLQGTSHKPDEVVGTMRRRQYTVEQVAGAAVMAGITDPKYLPSVLAIASAQSASIGSTTPMSKFLCFNGPVRKELNMNSGRACMSPFNEANSLLGRVFTILTKTVGTCHLDATYLGSVGNPLNYNNMTFAENEEKSPWQPFSVTQGFKPTDSTVSVFSLWTVISSRGGYWGGLNHAYTAAQEYCFMVQNINLHRSACTIIMDPIVAKYCYDDGFDTQSKLMTYISENAKISAGLYWASDHVAGFNMPAARQALEPYSSYLKAAQRDPNTLIKPFFNPKRMNVLVAGGSTQAISFVTDGSLVKCISIDEWK